MVGNKITCQWRKEGLCLDPPSQVESIANSIGDNLRHLHASAEHKTEMVPNLYRNGYGHRWVVDCAALSVAWPFLIFFLFFVLLLFLLGLAAVDFVGVQASTILVQHAEKA